MVTWITNDRGESVIAVGAPGSLARVRVERPALIDRLNELCGEGWAGYNEAIEEISRAGITSHIERESILWSSEFGVLLSNADVEKFPCATCGFVRHNATAEGRGPDGCCLHASRALRNGEGHIVMRQPVSMWGTTCNYHTRRTDSDYNPRGSE